MGFTLCNNRRTSPRLNIPKNTFGICNFAFTRPLQYDCRNVGGAYASFVEKFESTVVALAFCGFSVEAVVLIDGKPVQMLVNVGVMLLLLALIYLALFLSTIKKKP